MRVLVIKNSPLEGPGTIEDFLKDQHIQYKIVEAGLGEKITSLDGYSHLVVLGGHMGVYEMDKYPFLREIALLMEGALKKGVRILGICLGAQLFAHLLGSRVYPGKAKEIGWLKIKATNEGLMDEVFRTLIEPSGDAIVFQWHGDTYHLPEGAIRLASSELFPEQAFRYGDSYALQFHIEVSLEMVGDWFADSKELNPMLSKGREVYPTYREKAELFYKNFFKGGIS
ncbi:MAG: type 1 glutamine amidotransferase [Aquificaceae bacterium]